MFTNLGHHPFDSTFGPLKLESLWAPCALRGIEGEQTLGAVTVNSSLHLAHTSPAPIPDLLAGSKRNSAKPARSNPTCVEKDFKPLRPGEYGMSMKMKDNGRLGAELLKEEACRYHALSDIGTNH
jgi:hypothetical protein